MRLVLLDSSIYISALRAGDEAVLTLRRLTSEAPVWLSAVVLAELYAGVSVRDRRIIEHDLIVGRAANHADGLLAKLVLRLAAAGIGDFE